MISALDPPSNSGTCRYFSSFASETGGGTGRTGAGAFDRNWLPSGSIRGLACLLHKPIFHRLWSLDACRQGEAYCRTFHRNCILVLVRTLTVLASECNSLYAAFGSSISSLVNMLYSNLLLMHSWNVQQTRVLSSSVRLPVDSSITSPNFLRPSPTSFISSTPRHLGLLSHKQV